MSEKTGEISSRSQSVYDSHIQTLMGMGRSEYGDLAPEVTYEVLVSRFISSAAELRTSTRVVRKSAIMHFLKGEVASGKLTEQRFENLSQQVTEEVHRLSASEKLESIEGNHPSRSRARSISKNDYDIMRAWLEDRFESKKTGPLARLVFHFLTASCAVGARPIEWVNAQWANPERTVLRLFTAKTQKRKVWDEIPALSFTYEDFDQDALDLSPDLHDVVSHGMLDGVGLATADFENRISTLSLPLDELQFLREHRRSNGLALFRDIPVDPEIKPSVEYMLEAVQHDLHGRGLPYLDPQDLDAVQGRWIKGCYNRIRVHFMAMSRDAFPDRPAQRYSPADCRSTFAANQKARYGAREARKRLGHAGNIGNVINSTRHYAPARNAWPTWQGQERVVVPAKNPSQTISEHLRERSLAAHAVTIPA